MTLVTAVVLSYNRQNALRRQLLYYADKPVHLVLADGSNEDWGSGKSGSIGAMTWEYFRVEGYDSYTRRFEMAVSRVKTDYMYFLDDEECILWTGVEQAVRLLEENPEHSCAGGRVSKMSVEGHVATVGRRRLSVVNWGVFSTAFSLKSDNQFERLNLMVSSDRTANIYYQVHRSEFVKTFAIQVQAIPHSSGYAGTLEVLFTSIIILMGKWEMGSYPYWIRYGGSVIESDSPRPKVISRADSEDMANKIMVFFDDGLDPKKSEIDIELLRNKLAAAYFSRYGPKLKKRSSNPANSESTFRTKIASKLPSRYLVMALKSERRIKSVLFLWMPYLSEKLYPSGHNRITSYFKLSHMNQGTDNKDLDNFARIWTKYPIGITAPQLNEELQLRSCSAAQY